MRLGTWHATWLCLLCQDCRRIRGFVPVVTTSQEVANLVLLAWSQICLSCLAQLLYNDHRSWQNKHKQIGEQAIVNVHSQQEHVPVINMQLNGVLSNLIQLPRTQGYCLKFKVDFGNNHQSHSHIWKPVESRGTVHSDTVERRGTELIHNTL